MPATTEYGPCPHCGAIAVFRRRDYKRRDGTVSMRFRCSEKACSKSFSIVNGVKTVSDAGRAGGQANAWRVRALNPDQVLRVLTETEIDCKAFSRAFGCGRQCIADIRANRSYRDVHPEIERPGNRNAVLHGYEEGSCFKCLQWDGKCCLGFPEGHKGSFAPLCSCFQPVAT